MKPTRVFDTYWRFAAERQAMYMRRVTGKQGPWTADPILRNYRFTNAYRAADRVSQYLISDVQYGPHRSQAPAEVFFRTVLFKLFNRVETWRMLEAKLGAISWQATSLGEIETTMDAAFARGVRLYSAAYIMPAPRLGAERKHKNHLALLRLMMDDGLPGQIARASSLHDVFRLLAAYPGLGPFLAFQYAIDLNYSSLIDFPEHSFVVAGPGALDGIAKCFNEVGSRSAEDVIYWMADNQEREFERRGLDFIGLFGRRLQPIDCQNLFCEISKYARVAHPEVKGVADRTRIKQRYSPSSSSLPYPVFPDKWGLKIPEQLRKIEPSCLLSLIDAASLSVSTLT